MFWGFFEDFWYDKLDKILGEYLLIEVVLDKLGCMVILLLEINVIFFEKSRWVVVSRNW